MFGFLGPRRMSERDLPSRVLSEQQQNHQGGRGQLPPHAPQMHSSKSVPSLNSAFHLLILVSIINLPVHSFEYICE
jgi:hypothetical protein